MIGYVCLPRVRGDDPADRLLREIAHRLATDGVALAGAVQSGAPDRGRDMQLELLGSGESRVISHRVKVSAGVCRLDAGALEQAVERIAASLPGAQLVVLNKFGKQEAAGRGMRTLIAMAVEQDLPVLISVDPDVLGAFRDFAGEMATPLSAAEAEDWCRAAAGQCAVAQYGVAR